MNTQILVDQIQSFGCIINQEKSKLAPCKTHSGQMAQTSGFDPKNKVKACFDCKMFDVANCVARRNREDGAGGLPSRVILLELLLP